LPYIDHKKLLLPLLSSLYSTLPHEYVVTIYDGVLVMEKSVTMLRQIINDEHDEVDASNK
jgi:hypothetical protein